MYPADTSHSFSWVSIPKGEKGKWGHLRPGDPHSPLRGCAPKYPADLVYDTYEPGGIVSSSRLVYGYVAENGFSSTDAIPSYEKTNKAGGVERVSEGGHD